MFCDTYNKKANELELGEIFISSTAKYTRVGDGRECVIPLYFCPNCGKELDNPDNMCNKDAFNEIVERIKKYDAEKPNVVELRFIGDIVDKYFIEHRTAVRVISYIRRHPELLK